MKRSIVLLLFALIVPMVLVACDSDGDDSAVELPDSLTIETSFGYSATAFLPRDWPGQAIQGGDQFVICNHATCAPDFVGGNQILGNLVVFAEETLPEGIEADDSVSDVLDFVVNASIGDSETAELGEVETFELNGKTGASIYFVQRDGDGALEYGVTVVREETINGFSLLNMNGAEGEVEQFEDFLRAIVTSVALTPLDQ